MIIYKVKGKIFDNRDGAVSYCNFTYHQTMDSAEAKIRELQEQWQNYDICNIDFCVEIIDVIE